LARQRSVDTIGKLSGLIPGEDNLRLEVLAYPSEDEQNRRRQRHGDGLGISTLAGRVCGRGEGHRLL
jgi:hypothetical protein